MARILLVEDDLLKGYALGCEEYITKPFSLAVLLEKIKVVLRRVEEETSGQIYYYKQLSFYFVDENTLSVNIRRLRKKIEDNPSKPRQIKTVFGIGYKWCTL